MKHFLITALVCLSTAFAEHSIAVLDFTGEGLTQSTLDSLAESLRMELLQFDTLKVLDRDEMNQTLSGYGLTTCPSYDCAVVTGLILNVDYLVNTQVLKVGEVLVVQSQLYDPPTGRAINTVTYDRENSMEGLLTRGMKNVALMLMTQRIPLSVHQAKEMVYIHTQPAGAQVIIGSDTLPEVTPVALERVVVESKRIKVVKDQFKPFLVKKLPRADASRVIFIHLNPLRPVIKTGSIVFDQPIPKDIYLVPEKANTRLVVKPGTTVLKELKTGSYHLESDRYVVLTGPFKIYPKRSTRLKLELVERKSLKYRKKKLKRKRNLLVAGTLISVGYRGYLQYAADKNYQAYLKDLTHPEALRTLVEDQDRLKPYMAALAIVNFLPVIYYQFQIREINRLLALP